MPRTRPAAALPKCYRFNKVCGIDTMELPNPLDRENTIRKTHVICHGTCWNQGARRQDMTATETFDMLRRFWPKYYDAMEVLIMDRGTEFGADFQHLCQYRVFLLVVTDPETPWSNPVVERHEALFKMSREKPCSLEAPTTEAEVDELIDFTFAELIDGWNALDFQPVNERPDDSFDFRPACSRAMQSVQDDNRERRRSEVMRIAAGQGCAVAADSKVTTTAVGSRRRGPQSAMVTGETVFIHRRKNGAQGWRGPGVCVLSEDPKSGSNETVRFHMRNCLHKCNRTQVRLRPVKKKHKEPKPSHRCCRD